MPRGRLLAPVLLLAAGTLAGLFCGSGGYRAGPDHGHGHGPQHSSPRRRAPRRRRPTCSLRRGRALRRRAGDGDLEGETRVHRELLRGNRQARAPHEGSDPVPDPEGEAALGRAARRLRRSATARFRSSCSPTASTSTPTPIVLFSSPGWRRATWSWRRSSPTRAVPPSRPSTEPTPSRTSSTSPVTSLSSYRRS